MKAYEIKKLQSNIQVIVPQIARKWNQTKLKEFNKLYEEDFKSFFLKKKTQEITKIVSPILTNMFNKAMNKIDKNFNENDENGSDFIYKKTKIEGKITLSMNNDSWTGNGYRKVPFHILIRIRINTDGTIDQICSLIADISKTKGQWTTPKKKSNFSTLKFEKGDEKFMKIIHGSEKLCKKYIHFNYEDI